MCATTSTQPVTSLVYCKVFKEEYNLSFSKYETYFPLHLVIYVLAQSHMHPRAHCSCVCIIL